MNERKGVQKDRVHTTTVLPGYDSACTNLWMGTVALIQVTEPDEMFCDTNDREHQIKDTGTIEVTYLYRTTGSSV
jgi:hypothetical protein